MRTCVLRHGTSSEQTEPLERTRVTCEFYSCTWLLDCSVNALQLACLLSHSHCSPCVEDEINTSGAEAFRIHHLCTYHDVHVKNCALSGGNCPPACEQRRMLTATIISYQTPRNRPGISSGPFLSIDIGHVHSNLCRSPINASSSTSPFASPWTVEGQVAHQGRRIRIFMKFCLQIWSAGFSGCCRDTGRMSAVAPISALGSFVESEEESDVPTFLGSEGVVDNARDMAIELARIAWETKVEEISVLNVAQQTSFCRCEALPFSVRAVQALRQCCGHFVLPLVSQLAKKWHAVTAVECQTTLAC